MENGKQEKGKQTAEKPKSLVWDCDSSLYDSFELKSLQRQLNSAIISSSSSRTLSMPHLSDHHIAHSTPPQPPISTRQVAKKSSKFSKSFQKLVRAIFGPKRSNISSSNNKSLLKMKVNGASDGFYQFCDVSGALYTIPEVTETGGDHGCLSPEFKPSLAVRSFSDRCFD